VIYGLILLAALVVVAGIGVSRIWLVPKPPKHMFIAHCESTACHKTFSESFANSIFEFMKTLPWDEIEKHRGHKVRIFSTDGRQDEDAFEARESMMEKP
jgi:hypothetical protein